jgi:hypothetical protein
VIVGPVITLPTEFYKLKFDATKEVVFSGLISVKRAGLQAYPVGLLTVGLA